MKELQIYTDGGARGNPGPGAIGVHCLDYNKREVFTISRQIGIATNNIAEYTAVLEALRYLDKNNIKASKVSFFEDSLLIINQLNGLYRIKNARLREIKRQIDEIIVKLKIKSLSFNYIPREQNIIADKLVNDSFLLHN